MRKFKLGSFFIAVCMLLTMFPTAIIAEDTHAYVGGIISLPGDQKAAEEVKVTLFVGTDNLTPNNKNDDVLISHAITIPKGQNATNYSIAVRKSSNANAKFTVYYTVENGFGPFGWYSNAGTTPIKKDRTQINLNKGDVTGINIELLQGRLISGKIIHGNNKTTLTNDMEYTITAIQEGADRNTSDDDIIITGKVTVPKGTTEKSWQLNVPLPLSGNNKYRVYYTYVKDGYIETGYYYKNGTSYSESDVTTIDVSGTHTNINLTTKKFTNISGRFSLPAGEKVASKDITGIITAQNKGATSASSDDFSFLKEVTIPKGSAAVDYSLSVPAISSDYTVSYTVDYTGYIKEGYYNKDGTEASKSKATPVKTVEEAVNGINLTMLKINQPKPSPKPEPTPKPKPDPDKTDRYDLNNDGYVNVFDLLDLAKEIVARYEKDGFDKNLDQYKGKKMDNNDMKTVRDVFMPFTNNKYKTKWFDSLNKWFNFDLNFEWNFNSEGWKNIDWKNMEWKKVDWKNIDWDDWDWSDWCDNDDDDKNNNRINKNNKGNNNGKKQKP